MEVRRYTRPAEFRNHVLPWLCQNEVENTLLLSIIGQLQRDSHAYGPNPPVMIALYDKGEICYCAVQTPPHNLALAYTGDTSLIDQIISFLIANRIDVPGVLAFSAIAKYFAENWASLMNVDFILDMHERIYELTQINPMTLGEHKFSRVREKDINILVIWVRKMLEEAMHKPLEKSNEEIKRDLLKNDAWKRYYGIYIRDELASMAKLAGTTPSGQVINMVYTPPRLRQKGNATNCVAHLSKLSLNQGFKRCILFTDLDNPTSNKIYQLIGFRPIIDVDVYVFC